MFSSFFSVYILSISECIECKIWQVDWSQIPVPLTLFQFYWNYHMWEHTILLDICGSIWQCWFVYIIFLFLRVGGSVKVLRHIVFVVYIKLRTIRVFYAFKYVVKLSSTVEICVLYGKRNINHNTTQYYYTLHKWKCLPIESI